ncbi:MAG TPA: nuclear transport factor 2 family protein [Verrucomicrobiae bacterium]|nr:nuclear transport factor 2 family protein [Verrucomicrobiae bacterium]
MKSLLVVALLGFAFAFGQTSTEQTLTQTEKGLWEGWKTHNAEPFKKVMSDGIADLGADGIQTGDQLLKNMASTDCTVSSYSMDTPTFKWIDKNTVLMVYRASQDATCNGEKVPPAVWASTLWAKKGADWKAMFHQETPTK